jgi:ethanolamine ammonia-lyase large subunit
LNLKYQTTIRNEVFRFVDLKDLMAKANERKSGDELAGIAAESARQRIAAKFVLSEVPLRRFVEEPLIDESDEVSRQLLERAERHMGSSFMSKCVGELREFILAHHLDGEVLRALGAQLMPEMVAAVTKLMSNQDLVVGSSSIRNVTRCRNTMGESNVLGIRLQPNHPTDDLKGILLSTLDGLLYGCGDAVIGVNPATESVATVGRILDCLNLAVDRLRIPTQVCCLSHITTQLACLSAGARVDLLFQSIAGTEAGNRSFGVTWEMIANGREAVMASHRRDNAGYIGNQVMYFETGQGSALSAGAHHGVDQLTLEARAYGVAREFDPFLVNSVVGFIGPEYLADERQIIRAGLEDHFMGKLLGLPMGVDVCYTNHADADQNSADNLLMLLTAAGCNYFMGVPCADDVMLNYQSTSFHDGASMRKLFGKQPAPEFANWLREQGVGEGVQRDEPFVAELFSNGMKLLESVVP